jgi:uronate dehydrogenase
MTTNNTNGLDSQRVLLTGAAGKVAKRLRQPLAQLCRELVVTDLHPITDLASNERFVQCDMTNAQAVNAMMEGVQSVVHFAAYPRESDWATLIPANIVTITNLWEAAIANGVKRVVYASTNHVVGMYPTSQKIDIYAPVRCDSRYGVTKAFGETLARFYYEKYGILSLGLRIGRVEDVPSDQRMMSTWLHPEDLFQQVMLGLTGDIQADTLFGTSNNSKSWCINPTKPGLAYQPKHSADAYEVQPTSAEAGGSSWAFQGGPFAQNGYVGSTERSLSYDPGEATDRWADFNNVL